MTYVERLADLAATVDLAALGTARRERLRSCILYNLAVGLAGWSADDPLLAALSALAPAGGPSRQLVTGIRHSAAHAALLNAAIITARGQNDTYLPAQGHVGCVVLPAALAAAEACGASGAELMAAVAAGYETIGRVARPVADRIVARGLRATSVFGVFGAAAGAARAFGLSASKTAHALSLAASSAAGTLQCWSDGTMEWRTQVAYAARTGVEAALLAKGGVTGAKLALEGRSGFYQAYAAVVPDLDVGDGVIEDVLFKPLPGCAINQGPTFALLAIDADDRRNLDDIASIEVTLPPELVDYPGVAARGPFASQAAAIMSLPFMLAAAQRDGTLLQRHFRKEHGSTELAGYADRVTLVADATLPNGSSRVTRRTIDGAERAECCIDRDRFRFGWQETSRFAERLAEEMPFSGSERTTAGLIDVIAGIELDRKTDRLLSELCGLTTSDQHHYEVDN